jgi:RNA polymerase sigma-70 factor (ECF subfamily)
MGTDALTQRLSQIRTQWSEILDAHLAEHGSDIRNQLIHRYIGAVHRYILGAVGDTDLAEDLCQEFAVRFLRGDFRGADPGRGRFRDYVRTVLINLVNDAHRARQARPMALPEHIHAMPVAFPVDESSPDFTTTWREELIARTWDALAEENASFHAVLRLRVEEPELTSGAMAERLSVQFEKVISAENVRKSLERAHRKFAELLFEEVGTSLGTSDLREIEEELRLLDLMRFCRSAWERRAAGR